MAEAHFLDVTAPEDESVLDSATVEVMGATNPDNVVSVGGEVVEVDEDGNFTVVVTLEEGPNVIEVIASNFDGEEVDTLITVIYFP